MYVCISFGFSFSISYRSGLANMVFIEPLSIMKYSLYCASFEGYYIIFS